MHTWSLFPVTVVGSLPRPQPLLDALRRRQAKRIHLATFDSANAPAIYRGRQWPKPEGKLMSFTDQQLATLEQYYILDQKRVVHIGGIDVTLDPQMLGKPYVERADVIVLQVIKDQLKVNTDEVMARGGFGSPTIFIDRTDMYFGNDRLPLIREALQRQKASAA